MSLDNIQITPELIKDLYRKSLIDLDGPQIKANSIKAEWPFLGKNEKNIVIIVNEKDAAFLHDENLNFLMGVMGACNLTMADVALINYFTNNDSVYAELMTKFSPGKIIFFGIEPAALDFPLQFPNYQLQKYNHQVYLSAPSLNLIAKDIEQKKQLWNCLKNLFEIG